MATVTSVLKAIIQADVVSKTAQNIIDANVEDPQFDYLTIDNVPIFNYQSACFIFNGQDNDTSFPKQIVAQFGENKVPATKGIQIAFLPEESVKIPRESFNSDQVGAEYAMVEILYADADARDETLENLDRRVQYLLCSGQRSLRWTFTLTSNLPDIVGGYDSSIDPTGLDNTIDPNAGVTVFWLRHTHLTATMVKSLYCVNYARLYLRGG